jgi:hypothetical protein
MSGQVSEEIAALKAMVVANNAEITALKATRTTDAAANQDKSAKRAARAAKYAWQKVPPASSDPTSKVFEDRTYYWCPNHKSWTMHSPAECKGADYKKGSGSGNTSGNTQNQPQALVSIAAPVAATTKLEGVAVKVNEAYHTLVQYCGEGDEHEI